MQVSPLNVTHGFWRPRSGSWLANGQTNGKTSRRIGLTHKPISVPATADAVPDPRKLYQQVAAAVAEAIRRGDYVPGQRIPSERELADLHKVSRPTIREAMIALEVVGVVRSRHGSGIFVVDNPQLDAPTIGLDIGAFELYLPRDLFPVLRRQQIRARADALVWDDPQVIQP
eukprot:gene3205-4360_t